MNTQAILEWTKENLDYTNPEGFHRKLEEYLTAQEVEQITDELEESLNAKLTTQKREWFTLEPETTNYIIEQLDKNGWLVKKNNVTLPTPPREGE